MKATEFKQRIGKAMAVAGVERDSLFAHADSSALDVDKAWELGFLQGWLMCLRNVMELKETKWKPAQTKSANSCEQDENG
jgi:hypothetical protein